MLWILKVDLFSGSSSILEGNVLNYTVGEEIKSVDTAENDLFCVHWQH